MEARRWSDKRAGTLDGKAIADELLWWQMPTFSWSPWASPGSYAGSG